MVLSLRGIGFRVKFGVLQIRAKRPKPQRKGLNIFMRSAKKGTKKSVDSFPKPKARKLFVYS